MNASVPAMVALLLLPVLGTSPARAAEYFVSLQGDDARDGRTRETAFRSVQRGVDALAPGDTLTILPGEYFGNASRQDLGSDEADTWIRAEIPGTAVMRGDVAAPPLSHVPSTRFVYAAPFNQDPVAVLEVDTLTSLRRRFDVHSLEFEPGTFYFDTEAHRLYLASSDLRPPRPLRYSISTTADCGLLLKNPRRVTIEGLVARGYHPDENKGYKERTYVGGIVLHDPVDCTVRNATVLLNGQGVCMVAGERNVIEDCIGYGNGSPFHNQGGNFIIYSANYAVMRSNLSYASSAESIKFYSAFRGPALLEDNISWGTRADYYIKGDRAAEFGIARRNIGLGTYVVHNVTHNLIGDTNHYNRQMSSDNVSLPGVDRDAEFADPLNLDYRLQATSTLRGSGPEGVDRGPHPYVPNIYYVATSGDDSRDGLAVSHAWRTLDHALARLKPGDTLYLLEGSYRASASWTLGRPATGDAPEESAPDASKLIAIRGRGTDDVRIEGHVSLARCHGVTLERLIFTHPLAIEHGRNIRIANCRFFGAPRGLELRGVRDIDITHCEFTGFATEGLAIDSAQPQDAPASTGVMLSGNLFDQDHASGGTAGARVAIAVASADSVKYSDYNGFSSQARAWRIGATAHDIAQVRSDYQHERYSTVTPAAYEQHAGGWALVNREAFSAAGPAGTPAGLMPTHPQREIGFAGPFIHSTSDTTANVEWWTSSMALCEVAWGTTPDTAERRTLFVNGFGTLSLTGLEPGTTYHVRIRRVDPTVSPVPDRNFYLEHLGAMTPGSLRFIHTLAIEPRNATASFTTRSAASEPVTYYVAPDGDNARSGTSLTDAWRTVSHAAAIAAPGDTVLLAGGTYAETVRVRNTGEAGRPIRFAPVPGEKVSFSGRNGILGNAIIIAGKRAIEVDGFYFSGFGFAGPYASSIFVYQSDDVAITRCFLDGRHVAYNSPFLEAWASRNLRMANCVILQAMNTGIAVHNSENTWIEHNVFFRNFTCHATIVNRPEQKAVLRLNIFTDLTVGKERVPLFESPEIESLILADNCFMLRSDPAERAPVFYFYRSAGRLKLPDYFAQRGRSGSVAKDPRFAGSLDLPNDAPGRYIPDVMIRDHTLDFQDFFTTDSDLATRGVGLQPQAFEDFHFTSP